MRLHWTDRARRDLLDTGRYIALDNAVAARRWVERLRDKARHAAANPRAGRVVPEWQCDDVREVFLKTYRIVYRVQEDGVHVLTVFEGHRLLPSDAIPDEPA